MPRAPGKGGKQRKKAKAVQVNVKRELLFKDAEDQEYAQILKMLGNGRLECFCFDGVKRQATIRGKLRKKVWMNIGDVVLVSLRSYQDEKCDVMHKYQPDEVRKLKNKGEIPESLHINEEDGENHV